MNTPSLSSVTLQTLKNYRVAAEQTVAAYRSGSHRLVAGVNRALVDGVYPRTAQLAPQATERMDEVRGNVSKYVVKGIDLVAERTEQAIEAGSATVTEQVKRVAALAAGVENETVASGLEVAARLTMPGAKVALAVSGKIAEGANALADAAGVRPARKVVRKAVRKATAGAKRQAAATKRRTAPLERKARTAVKTAGRRATKVAKAIEAEVAKAPRRARAAKKSIVAAATS